jgi:hypothetical protein
MRIRYVEVPDVDLPRLVAKRQNPLLAVHREANEPDVAFLSREEL